MRNIIALNVKTNEKVINEYPLMFSSNAGISDIKSELVKNAGFKDWLFNKNIINTVGTYCKTSVCCVGVDADESFKQLTFTIQELYSLKDFSVFLIEDHLKEALSHLYALSFKKDYEFNPEISFIEDIYAQLKLKYTNKLDKKTFINAVKNFYQVNYPSLSKDNFNTLIDFVDKSVHE